MPDSKDIRVNSVTDRIKDVASRKSTEIKNDLQDIVRDDVIGVRDWKSSKVGALTGFSLIARSLGSVSKSMSAGSSHVSGLIQGLTAKDEIAALDASYDNADGRERFEASMELHGRTERDLSVILRNSFWSTYLYLLGTAIYVVFFVGFLIASPPSDLMMLVIRLGPLPLVVALFLRHSYTNWMVRNRTLGGLGHFFKTFAFLPTK